ncbi:MAG: flagellin [Tepidisphaeraceae bacterium]|jgi:flagellin
MSRINTNIPSLMAMQQLSKNSANLSTSLQRLSTGLQINSGKDAPAGLIASQTLQSEMAGINQAIANSSSADNVLSTAEGSLQEVSSLLLEVQSLTTQAANSGALSSDEIAANQLQVDSILSSINRISNTTQFNGVKLIDGSMDYTTAGVNPTNFATVNVNSALLVDNAPMNVVVAVTQSARTGTIGYTGGTLAAGNAVTVQVAGNKGSQQVSFAGGTTIAQMITAINAVTGSTGVSAINSGGDLGLYSVAFGSKQYVSLQTVSGTFAPTASIGYGRDANVTVNGAAAQADGLSVSYRNSNLDLQLQLGTAFNTVGNDQFQITGGGAVFQLGAKVDTQDKASIGLQSVSTGSLGNSITGYLSTLGSGAANSLSSGNLNTAQKIIDAAIAQVSTLRGRIGAFQKEVLDPNVSSLNVALENVTASESSITDTDFAAETANMTRAQILVQATTTVLAQANSSPQNVLTLLKG